MRDDQPRSGQPFTWRQQSAAARLPNLCMSVRMLTVGFPRSESSFMRGHDLATAQDSMTALDLDCFDAALLGPDADSPT
jgi:hypothetical protein